MLTITSQKTKKGILDALIRESKKKGELEIAVESLPSFLNTPVAFTVFSYQIGNFPRKIVWTSSDPAILSFLKNCDVQVREYGTKSQERVGLINVSKKVLPREEVGGSDKVAIKNDFSEEQDIQGETTNYGVSQYGGESGEHDSSFVENVERRMRRKAEAERGLRESNFGLGGAGTFRYNEGAFNYTSNKGENQNEAQNKISSSQVFSREMKYNPGSYLSEDSEQEVEPKSKTFVNQGYNMDDTFDAWLTKIDSTKEALEEIKTKQMQSMQNQSSEKQIVARDEIKTGLAPKKDTLANKKWFTNQAKPKKIKKDKNFGESFRVLTTKFGYYGLAALLMVSLFGSSFLFFFPTNVYTIEVKVQPIQSGQILEIPVSEFDRKVIESNADFSVVPTGTKEVKTINSTGKVSLVNKSGNDITISNGRFYVEKDGKKYRAVYNNNYSKSITIPSRNDLTGKKVLVDVVAVESGKKYDQVKGEKLSILNLQGQSVGSLERLYARAYTDIKSQEGGSDKIVTKTDLDLLKTTNEGVLEKDRIDAMRDIQGGKYLTNPEWYVNSSYSLSYSHKQGEAADNVFLTTEATASIYYISKDIVASIIKKADPEVYNIEDIMVKTWSGNFNSQDSEIKLNVLYTYTKKLDLNKDQISQSFEDKAFDNAKNRIKEDYPEVYSIKKKEFGLQLPGIKPRTDVDIVETN